MSIRNEYIALGNCQEESMHIEKLIIELYPKTKDAVLVDRYFSGGNPGNFQDFLLKKFKDELLKEAKELEEKKENK